MVDAPPAAGCCWAPPPNSDGVVAGLAAFEALLPKREKLGVDVFAAGVVVAGVPKEKVLEVNSGQSRW